MTYLFGLIYIYVFILKRNIFLSDKKIYIIFLELNVLIRIIAYVIKMKLFIFK